VFGFTRNQCSASIGIDVRLAPEWAFGFNRNECSTSAGLCIAVLEGPPEATEHVVQGAARGLDGGDNVQRGAAWR